MTRKDDVTAELPGVPRRRGRPPTGKAQTDAQRQASRRARLASAGLETIQVQVPADVAEALRAYVARRTSDAEPMTLSDAVERILRDRLMRKR